MEEQQGMSEESTEGEWFDVDEQELIAWVFETWYLEAFSGSVGDRRGLWFAGSWFGTSGCCGRVSSST